MPQSRYLKEEKLGEGGMAQVWLGVDTLLKRHIAIKEIHPHLLNKPGARRRFIREARAIASLSHPNIVSIYDVEEEPVPRIIMEYVRGKTLDALLEVEPVLPNLVTLEIGRQLFQGLAAAHEKGVIHRDLKPSNLILTPEGVLKIMDFGIALLGDQEHLTASGAFLGSPLYTSPEIVRGLEVSPKSDVFSAGALLYECLAGESAFKGASTHQSLKNICEREPDPLVDKNPKALRFCGEWIGGMLSKENASRPASPDVLNSLQTFSRESALSLSPSRLSQWMEDGKEYLLREEKELHRWLTEQESRAKAGNPAEWHRLAYQKKLFGPAQSRGGAQPPPTKQPPGSQKPGPQKRTLLKWATTAGVLAGALAVAVWFSHRTQSAVRDLPAVEEHIAYPGDRKVNIHSLDNTSGTKRENTAQKAAANAGKENQPSGTAQAAIVKTEREDGAPEKSGGANAPEHQTPSPGVEKETTAGTSGLNNPPPGDRDERTPRNKTTEPGKSTAGPGYVHVKTRPPFAKIYMNAKYMGDTPTKKPVPLSKGSHSLVLIRKGCKPVSREIEVTRGDTLYLALELPAL